MRKLTGYIGAMIIVFALMGSILAGYALNINGTTAVINDYEPVTDVSGLYTHSDEKSYIDYNPASNYIGYNETYTEDNGQLLTYSNHYKSLNDGTVIVKLNTVGVSINNGPDYAPSLPYYAFVCDYFYLYYESGNALTYYPHEHSTRTPTNDVIITITGNTINVKDNGSFNHTYTNVKNMLAYTGGDDWDYRCTIGTYTLPLSGFYLNDENQVIGTTTGGSDGFGIFIGNTWRAIGSSTTATVNAVVSNGNNRYTINDVRVSWGVFYPKSVSFTDIGINYTESTRVNNYPIEYDYSTNTTVLTSNIDLMAMSASNRWTGNFWNIDYLYYGNEAYNNDHQVIVQHAQFNVYNGIVEYTIQDILSTVTIPTGTTTIRFDCGNIDHVRPVVNLPVDPSILPWGNITIRGNNTYDSALTVINPTSNYYANAVMPYYPTYAIYYLDTGVIDIYNAWTDVKINTSSIYGATVRFVENTTNTGTLKYDYQTIKGSDSNIGSSETSFNLASPRTPNLRLTFTVNGVITDTHYMDITKGVSIKNTNISNTVWNNSYENSNIQILFRAENNASTYSNDLTVVGNDINVLFDGGQYYVTLGTNDPVNIGAWRNIVLDIDLINKELSVIPVKTFNSYTNVQLMNTEIPIGTLTGATPTSSISWGPSSNSFTFNVYSTSVFMNTYGVVMVNPALNINNYFTDLNQFYRLNLKNFSVYGNSMTINGITAPVVNGTVTFDGETIRLNDVKITYADGHAFIADNNTSIDLGEIATTDISFDGAWYFVTDLLRGYTSQKIVYDWDWTGFILDNTQFCIFYIGLALVGLVIARRYCNLSIIDYMVFITSIIIALTVNVIV